MYRPDTTILDTITLIFVYFVLCAYFLCVCVWWGGGGGGGGRQLILLTG